MLSLPLSLVGVALALLATGDTLNMMSMIGLIMLMGLVTKNAILLVDFTNQARAAGTAPRRGAHQGRLDAPAAHRHDDAGDDLRHAAARLRDRRRGRDARADGPRRHRRAHHLDAAHAGRRAGRLHATSTACGRRRCGRGSRSAAAARRSRAPPFPRGPSRPGTETCAASSRSPGSTTRGWRSSRRPASGAGARGSPAACAAAACSTSAAAPAATSRSSEAACARSASTPATSPSRRRDAAPPASRSCAPAPRRCPSATAAFDTVVSGLVFCSVGDVPRGLGEVRRVLRPGGVLRMLEHVRSRAASRRGCRTARSRPGPGSPAAATRTATPRPRSPRPASSSTRPPPRAGRHAPVRAPGSAERRGISARAFEPPESPGSVPTTEGLARRRHRGPGSRTRSRPAP